MPIASVLAWVRQEGAGQIANALSHGHRAATPADRHDATGRQRFYQRIGPPRTITVQA